MLGGKKVKISGKYCLQFHQNQFTWLGWFICFWHPC